mgnify:CR=1 FL=1
MGQWEDCVLDSLQAYTVTDISVASFDCLQNKLRYDPRVMKIQNLYQCQSTDIKVVAKGITPDIIVINSVIQYFPSSTYLHDTIISSTNLLFLSKETLA